MGRSFIFIFISNSNANAHNHKRKPTDHLHSSNVGELATLVKAIGGKARRCQNAHDCHDNQHNVACAQAGRIGWLVERLAARCAANPLVGRLIQKAAAAVCALVRVSTRASARSASLLARTRWRSTWRWTGSSARTACRSRRRNRCHCLCKAAQLCPLVCNEEKDSFALFWLSIQCCELRTLLHGKCDAPKQVVADFLQSRWKLCLKNSDLLQERQIQGCQSDALLGKALPCFWR